MGPNHGKGGREEIPTIQKVFPCVGSQLETSRKLADCLYPANFALYPAQIADQMITCDPQQRPHITDSAMKTSVMTEVFTEGIKSAFLLTYSFG